MATITTIQGSDVISTSRTDINTNFTNLNSDKIETSYLDTDTSLTANSDSKIATQKAVKAYVDSGGQANASETVRGLVEEATQAEVDAGTATGGTGAKLIVTPAKLATRLTAVYQPLLTFKNGVTTRAIDTADGAVNIAHGLGKTPKRVAIKAQYGDSGTFTTIRMIQSYGVYNGTTTATLATISTDGSNISTVTDTTNIIKIQTATGGGPSQGTVAVISVDATNITLTWTKNGTPGGTVQIIWEAEA